MAKILSGIMMLSLMTTTLAFATPEADTSNDTPDGSEFWPPDIVPHPHCPGSGPKVPNKADDLA